MKNISYEKDRHGNVRTYFRKMGRRVRITAQPDTQEWAQQIADADAYLSSRRAPTPRTGSKPKSYVYFVRYGPRRVKIGVSKNPSLRLSSIQTSLTGNATLYYVTPGGRDLEAHLHELFASDRVNREWFVYSKAIQDWIKTDEERRFSERQENADCRTGPAVGGNLDLTH